MSDPKDTTGNQPQPIDQPRVKTTSTGLQKNTQRKLRGENWLRLLRTLPANVLQACTQRLVYGTSAQDVAVWVMTLPDRERGGCQHLAYQTMRQYMQYFRFRLLEADRQQKRRRQRLRLLRELTDNIQREQVKHANVVSIQNAKDEAEGREPTMAVPTVMGRKEIMQMADEALKGLTTREGLVFAYIFNRERLWKPFGHEQNIGLPIDSLSRISAELNKTLQTMASHEIGSLKVLGAPEEDDREERVTLDGTTGQPVGPSTAGEARALLTPDEINFLKQAKDIPPPTRILQGEAIDLLTKAAQLQVELRNLEAMPAPPKEPPAK